MFLGQSMHHTPAVRLRAVAAPHVNAATLRSSCIVHGKTTVAQLKEREMIEASISALGTPVVDYLLETSPYSQFLDHKAITSMREREKSLGDAATGEKLRRLRIAFANKGRKPWNTGKHHKPGTIARIREGVAKAMKDPAVIAKLRDKYIPQTPESRAKINEKIKLRVGWRRSVVYTNRDPAKRKVRRKLTEEELKASKERARQRCADAMKKKWQDPEYRARQEQAIRDSHKISPRRPKRNEGRAPKAKQSRSRRPKLSPLQKRLKSDQKAFEDMLQELQQTRAYCAKFEGVVSKLQAQVPHQRHIAQPQALLEFVQADSLEGQAQAQQQVQQALDGVLASQDKALDTISALERKVAKLQGQVESTQLALAKQQRLAEEATAAEATQAPEGTAGPVTAANGDSGGDAGISGAGATGTAGLVAVSTAANGGPPGHTVAGSSRDPGQAASTRRGAVSRSASGSGVAHAATGPGNTGNTGDPARPDNTLSALKNVAVADVAGSSSGNGRDATTAGALHEPARVDGMVPAQRPLVGHAGHGDGNGSGHGMGVPEIGSASPDDSVGANGFSSGAFAHHNVDLDRLRVVADGGASLAIPTAAEWKKKMFDTSQNGHVVTDALSSESGFSDTDGEAGNGLAGGSMLVQSPPGTAAMHLDLDTHGDQRASSEVVSGNGVHGQAVDAAADDEDEEQPDSLRWLREREHKLPWQQ